MKKDIFFERPMVGGCKVFNSDMVGVFNSQNWPLLRDIYPSMNDGDFKNIIEVYILSYKRGEEYFRSLLGQLNIYNSQEMTRCLEKLENLAESQVMRSERSIVIGWLSVMHLLPNLEFSSEMETCGYYSGVLGAFEDFVNTEFVLISGLGYKFKTSIRENLIFGRMPVSPLYYSFLRSEDRCENDGNMTPDELRFDKMFQTFFVSAIHNNRILDFEFNNLKTGLRRYFDSASNIKGNVVFQKFNVKATCYALGELYKGMNDSKSVTVEYFEYCVGLIPSLGAIDFKKFSKYSKEKTVF